MGVGHYGVFNGSRFRSEIQPRIADFIGKHRVASNGGHEHAARPARGKRVADIQNRLADAFGITALAGKRLPDADGAAPRGKKSTRLVD